MLVRPFEKNANKVMFSSFDQAESIEDITKPQTAAASEAVASTASPFSAAMLNDTLASLSGGIAANYLLMRQNQYSASHNGLSGLGGLGTFGSHIFRLFPDDLKVTDRHGLQKSLKPEYGFLNSLVQYLVQ